MAAPSVSLLYASGLAHTVVGLWDLVELALQLTLLLPSSYFVPGGDGKRSAGQFTPSYQQQGKNLNVGFVLIMSFVSSQLDTQRPLHCGWEKEKEKRKKVHNFFF